MAHKFEITDSYFAVNVKGEQSKIDVHTRYSTSNLVDGQIKWKPGRKVHKMQNGNHVNILPDGTLEDSVTGTQMRKV